MIFEHKGHIVEVEKITEGYRDRFREKPITAWRLRVDGKSITTCKTKEDAVALGREYIDFDDL